MNKVILITGASQGIGKLIMEEFHHHGFRTISVSRTSLPFSCKHNHHIIGDLSKEQELQKICDDIRNILHDKPLYALIHNAATSPKTSYKERLGCLNGDMDMWYHVFQLNFFTPLILTRFLAKNLIQSVKEQNGGSVVHISSIAAERIHPFAGAAYSCSKAALSALSRELASEFAEVGVRVNAVVPGEIITDMISEDYEPLTNRIPLQRMGKAEEVAKIVYHLCSEDFSYVTGDNIHLTGGQHIL